MAVANKQSGRNNSLAQTLRALRGRNYRLFFFGQGVSVIGTWMQGTTLSWLVYLLTGSPVWLGIVGFCSQGLTFIIAPFAGVLADRLERRKLLVTTQSLAMCQAFALAALTLTGLIHVWHIVALAALLGLVSAFDIPIRQSFVVEMLEDRADLPNAIALNSSLVNGGRIVGPSLAGLLIAALSGYDIGALQQQGAKIKPAGPLWGEGLCFFINGVSYLAVLFALLAMKLAPRPASAPRRRVLHELREGFAYAFGFGPIRRILLMLALVSLMASYGTLLPVFAKDILHGTARTFGFLSSAAGVGALAGAIFLASRRSVVGLARVIAVGALLMGLGLIGFSQSAWLPLSLVLLVLTGFGFMVQMASSNTIIQTIVEDDKRGRVMSFYTVSFMGMAPFGALLAGVLAWSIGAPGALIVSGLCCLAGALLFGLRLKSMRAAVRPIYQRLGILPADAAPEATPSFLAADAASGTSHDPQARGR